MTQEEKSLLLQDLCARLPYMPKIKIIYQQQGIKGTDEGNVSCDFIEKIVNDLRNDVITNIQIYLRPMSSMTEEEFEKLKEYSGLKYEQLDLASYQNGTYKCLDFYLSEVPSYVVILVFDWLNENMFDYRGLISMGLALKASEGMYNIISI